MCSFFCSDLETAIFTRSLSSQYREIVFRDCYLNSRVCSFYWWTFGLLYSLSAELFLCFHVWNIASIPPYSHQSNVVFLHFLFCPHSFYRILLSIWFIRSKIAQVLRIHNLLMSDRKQQNSVKQLIILQLKINFLIIIFFKKSTFWSQAS